MKPALFYSGLFTLVFICGCQKDETVDRDYPRIRTTAVSHITSEGARFNATVLSGSMENVSEYGFVWGTLSTLSIDNDEKIMVTENPDNSGFSCEVTFALQAMKEYSVRAYVKAGDLVIYGDIVKFMSLGSQAPILTDFEPKTATWGDTVTLFGSNFTYQNYHINVNFGGVSAAVVKSTKDYIVVTVPDGLSKPQNEVTASILGNIAHGSEPFNLITYGSLSKVNPGTVKWGDTLTLEGVFPYLTHDVGVRINGSVSKLQNISENKLEAILPPMRFKDSVLVELVIDNHLLYSNIYVKMAKPELGSIPDSPFGWEDTIAIDGYFDPIITNNKVYFNGVSAKILEVSHRNIKCVVPLLKNHSAHLLVVSSSVSLNYSENIEFSGPVITSITPSTVTSNARIVVKGKYFHPEEVTLIFGNWNYGTIQSVTSRRIEATLPYLDWNGPIPLTILVLGKSKTYENLLTVANPVIHEISPSNVFYGDEVTISGINFDPVNVHVKFGDIFAPIVSASTSSIVFRIPNNIRFFSPMVIETGGQTIQSNYGIYIDPPEVSQINPTAANPGETLLITGDRFNPEWKYDFVYFSGQSGLYAKGEVTGGDTRNIQVKVPSLTQGTYNLEISSGANGIMWSSFQCNGPWKLIKYLQGTHYYPSTISKNNKLYIMGGNSPNYFQVIDLATAEVSLFSYPYSNASQHESGIAFAIGNTGYFGLGNLGYLNPTSTFYKFDLTNNSWELLNNFPGELREGSFSFSIGDYGYMGTGSNSSHFLSDFWRYEPSTDSWTKLQDFPGGATTGATAVVYDGKAYVIDLKSVWVFDPETSNWSRKADFPATGRYKGVGVETASGIYYGTGASNFLGNMGATFYQDFWFYSVQSESWTRLTDFPFAPRTRVIGASFNNLLLLGLGYYQDEYNESHHYSNLFEYNPDLE